MITSEKLTELADAIALAHNLAIDLLPKNYIIDIHEVDTHCDAYPTYHIGGVNDQGMICLIHEDTSEETYESPEACSTNDLLYIINHKVNSDKKETITPQSRYTLRELINGLTELLVSYPQDADIPVKVHVLNGGDSCPIVNLDHTINYEAKPERLHTLTLDIQMP